MKQNRHGRRPSSIIFTPGKEDNYDKGKELGLTGQALDDFMYCCYELEVTLVIEQDGSTIMTHVDGTELKRSIGVV